MTRNYPPILITLLILFTNSLFAQHTIKGKLVTETNNPVAFANVILLDAQDSTSVYKGTISEDNGEFLLEEIGRWTRRKCWPTSAVRVDRRANLE